MAAETTNEKIGEVLRLLDTLIQWADADSEHSEESDASSTAKNDRRRAENLRAARDLVEASRR